MASTAHHLTVKTSPELAGSSDTASAEHFGAQGSATVSSAVWSSSQPPPSDSS